MSHVLIVDDKTEVRKSLAEIASDEGYTVAQADDVRGATLQVERQKPDILLLDLDLPGGNGVGFLKTLSLDGTRLVFMTGHPTIGDAVEALRMGAVDYLVKPVGLKSLQRVLREMKSVLRQAAPGCGLSDMLGNSAAMQSLLSDIKKVARTDATVLLVGESGTGKELAAEAIHRASARSSKPLLPINCGAISSNLIESELFGHEKGSFTGADRQHQGFFERADGGTLFLDEITEMSMDLQVRLLRVLETGSFMRIGARDEIAVDVRIIAATNRSPEQAVRDGKLREDLYYRLNVFPLHLPALRERGDDVILIAENFLSELNLEYTTHKKFSSEILLSMRNHNWPGNIRELRNFVYRSYIRGNQIIGDEFDFMSPESVDGSLTAAAAEITMPVGIDLEEASRQLIMATLEQCGGVKKRAAHTLGISLKTLYNRLEAYAISEREGKSPMARSTHI